MGESNLSSAKMIAGGNRKIHGGGSILLAEDDREMRKMLAESLRREGYTVHECPDGLQLLDNLGELLFLRKGGESIDLIISDVRMPGESGLEILEQFHNCQGFPPMILITAFGDESTHVRAHWFGAAAMFDKPFDLDELIDKVSELLSPSATEGKFSA